MIITNIQRMSLDDGPGIRTTVFVKGCPLKCKWCHNPECMKTDGDAVFFQEFPKAFVYRDSRGLCDRLQRDHALYEATGGGVTISGGEPLLYPEFVKETGMILQQEGIDLAVDTCGSVPWESVEMVLPVVKLFLYDLKVFHTEKHKELTGVGNMLIWQNLDRLLARGKKLYIRIPVIGGANEGELEEIAEQIPYSPSILRVEFLPYHSYGISKYAKLGVPYPGTAFYTPETECCHRAAQILQKKNLKCYLQGDELHEREE